MEKTNVMRVLDSHKLPYQAHEYLSTGAISAYSYLQKMAFGLRHFAALNRKFDIRYVDQSDVIPLTRDAKAILRGTWFDD